MRTYLRLTAIAVFVLSGTALPRADEPAKLPEQCAAMMPMMMQMMQSMQGMQGGMGNMAGMAGMPKDNTMPDMAGLSDAGKAYMDAMKKMDPPMMTAALEKDPDVAFVKGMIPHHQGAIDMAKAVLQHGKDDKVKAWANQIIKAQEAEIAEMQAWLKDRGG
jgi:uncharacterized protein (DUF305 family)